jgi:hypothetical protein
MPLALALPFQVTPLAERREVEMRKIIRIFVGGTLLATALAFFVPAPAQAQVRFYGRFPLPYGSISVGVGDPYYGGYGYYGYGAFPVGSYVPYGYRVIYRPRFGYGFYSPAFACRTHRIYHSHWIPVRSYGARYIVIDRPFIGGYGGYGGYYGRSYRPYYGDRYYSRDYGRRYSGRDSDGRDSRRRDWDRRDSGGRSPHDR